jgi:signal transduction histidine kinase
MKLSRLFGLLPGNAIEPQATAREMSGLIEESMLSMKKTVKDLRPLLLDDFGIVAALEALVADFKSTSGIRCQLQIQPEDFSPDNSLSITIYRICQEALTNVMKHASATRVRITLIQKNRYIRLKITDNGKGIPKNALIKKDCYGLAGMKERIFPFEGQMTIRGLPNCGTSISIQLPC